MSTDSMPPERLAEARVLVVAEHPGVREMIRHVLRDAGIRAIREAGSGAQGIDVVRQWLPQVMICDIAMEEMDGLTMVAALQTEGYSGSDRIPTIFLDHTTDRDRVLRAKQLDADGFLIKPITAKQLISRLRYALGRTN